MVACCECGHRGAPERVPNQRGNAREALRPQGDSACLPAGGSPPSRQPGRRSWTATFSFAAPGLSCALSVFHLGCRMLDVSVAACGIYFSDQGLNPGPPALGVWSLGLWTTRSPRNFIQRQPQQNAPLHRRDSFPTHLTPALLFPQLPVKLELCQPVLSPSPSLQNSSSGARVG